MSSDIVMYVALNKSEGNPTFLDETSDRLWVQHLLMDTITKADLATICTFVWM